MRIHRLIKKDDVIYWKKIGVNDEGEAYFKLPPEIIKCRWDIVRTDLSNEDVLTLEVASNTIYPEKVLVIGSYIMLGGQDVLDSLTDEQIENPRFIREARSIKSQSWVFEFGWYQQNVPPDFKSEHITIECQI